MADDEGTETPPPESQVEQQPEGEAGEPAETGEETAAPVGEQARPAEGAEVVSDSGLIPLASADKLDEVELDVRPSESQPTAGDRRTVQSVSSIDGEKVAAASAARAERKARYSSKQKLTLGSVIDIRRGTVAGDVSDRKVVRYMNTYKMESDNPFNPQKVEKILRTVMTEAIHNLTYDSDKCSKQAKWASMAIRGKVKELEFDRYKIINLVTIGEKHSQDMYATCRFLWDAEKDRYATYAMENTYVYGIAQCFGLYYE